MKVKQEKGITLIALVITIIVLLILVGATISMLFGTNGIILRAQNATKSWNQAEKDEQEGLNNLVDEMDKNINGEGAIYIKPGEKAQGGNQKYRDGNGDIATIPEGFVVSDKIGETTINKGLVVIAPDGSEIVWIPVSSVSRIEWATEWDHNIFYDEKNTELTTSIAKYGGFYVGRYESSYLNGNASSLKSSSTRESSDISLTNGMLWNFIIWTEANSKATSYASDNNISSVKSGLLTGAQWDTILKWLVDTGAKTQSEVELDSTSWGNYGNAIFTYSGGIKESATMIDTGSTEYTKANNIYDMAGNLSEWTSERYDSTLYANRRWLLS